MVTTRLFLLLGLVGVSLPQNVVSVHQSNEIKHSIKSYSKNYDHYDMIPSAIKRQQQLVYEMPEEDEEEQQRQTIKDRNSTGDYKIMSARRRDLDLNVDMSSILLLKQLDSQRQQEQQYNSQAQQHIRENDDGGASLRKKEDGMEERKRTNDDLNNIVSNLYDHEFSSHSTEGSNSNSRNNEKTPVTVHVDTGYILTTLLSRLSNHDAIAVRAANQRLSIYHRKENPTIRSASLIRKIYGTINGNKRTKEKHVREGTQSGSMELLQHFIQDNNQVIKRVRKKKATSDLPIYTSAAYYIDQNISSTKHRNRRHLQQEQIQSRGTYSEKKPPGFELSGQLFSVPSNDEAETASASIRDYIHPLWHDDTDFVSKSFSSSEDDVEATKEAENEDRFGRQSVHFVNKSFSTVRPPRKHDDDNNDCITNTPINPPQKSKSSSKSKGKGKKSSKGMSVFDYYFSPSPSMAISDYSSASPIPISDPISVFLLSSSKSKSKKKKSKSKKGKSSKVLDISMSPSDMSSPSPTIMALSSFSSSKSKKSKASKKSKSKKHATIESFVPSSSFAPSSSSKSKKSKKEKKKYSKKKKSKKHKVKDESLTPTASMIPTGQPGFGQLSPSPSTITGDTSDFPSNNRPTVASVGTLSPNTGGSAQTTAPTVVGIRRIEIPLSPYYIFYTIDTDEIPLEAEVDAAITVTQDYLNEWFLANNGRIIYMNTTTTGNQFVLNAPYEIYYNSVAYFPWGSAFPPEFQIEKQLIQALSPPNDLELISLLQDLPDSNPFSTTTAISHNATSARSFSSPQPVTRSKATIGAITGTFAFAAMIGGILLLEKRSKKDGEESAKKAPKDSGYMTVAGDTYPGTSTVWSGISGRRTRFANDERSPYLEEEGLSVGGSEWKNDDTNSRIDYIGDIDAATLMMESDETERLVMAEEGEQRPIYSDTQGSTAASLEGLDMPSSQADDISSSLGLAISISHGLDTPTTEGLDTTPHNHNIEDGIGSKASFCATQPETVFTSKRRLNDSSDDDYSEDENVPLRVVDLIKKFNPPKTKLNPERDGGKSQEGGQITR